MRLGFAVKVLGRPGLKASDSRRWQNNPHLSVSLAYLRDILVYLEEVDIRMYRMSPNLAPYVTHPDLPQFHDQVAECAAELAAVGAMARRARVRLSFHPLAYTVLNAPDAGQAQKAAADLESLARMLELMGLGPEAVIVVHVGGVYEDKQSSIARFIERYRQLPDFVRRRLALENDERGYNLGDTLSIHRATGIRLVFDLLHHLCNPTPGMDVRHGLEQALGTWPSDQVPKIHYSSPRTAMVAAESYDEEGHKARTPRLPRLCQHADLIDPFAFIEFLRLARGLRDFDVMLECKARDLALLRLRDQLRRFAPQLAAHYGLLPARA